MDEKWSDAYNESWEIYDKFSLYEDYGDKAFQALLEHVDFTGATVYEYGCGTGKYTEKIAGICERLYANDISGLMISIARQRCSRFQNISYIEASAEHSGLEDSSVDIVFGAWAGPPFDETATIMRIEEEFSRILKPTGSVWIFTNYYLGEFTRMRGIAESTDPGEAVAFFTDHMDRYGYRLVEVVPAHWMFPSLEEAKRVCSFIFGDNAIRFFEQKGHPVMEDNIAVFSRVR